MVLRAGNMVFKKKKKQKFTLETRVNRSLCIVIQNDEENPMARAHVG